MNQQKTSRRSSKTMKETSTNNNTTPVSSDYDKDMYFLYTGGRCPDKSITHTIINTSVSFIERAAFAGCKKLKSVQFGGFDNDNDDDRNDTTGSDKMKDNPTTRLTTIEAAAFAGCHRLEYIFNIPLSVKKIGDFAFRDCFQLTELNFASSVDGNNTAQTTNNDASVLEEIGEGAFRRCRLLATIGDLPASIKQIGREAFYECSSLSGNLRLPLLLEEISPYTFYKCSSLESVHVPNILKQIGVWAFSYCDLLRLIDLPDSIEKIGNHAFFSCRSLADITLPKNMTAVEPSTFYMGGLTSLHLHDRIERIGDHAFEACRSLFSITINCRESGIDVSDKELDPCLIGEVQETEDGECDARSKRIKSIKKSSIKRIGKRAFLDCESLKNLDVLLGSVEEIGSHAFSGCHNITHVELPNSVRTLGEGAFGYCNKLSTASLPESIQVIPSNTFCWCQKLQSIDIPPSVKTIGYHAFQGCSELSKINFFGKSHLDSCGGNSALTVSNRNVTALQEIQACAFYMCRALKSVYLPDSVHTIGSSAFAYCDMLHAVQLGNAMMKIDKYAFSPSEGNYSLQEFTFSVPSTLSAIFEDEFEGTTTNSKEVISVMETVPAQIVKEKEAVVRIRFDNSPSEMIRRIRLYQFVCDFNRGGGSFLQRQQQAEKQSKAPPQQSMEITNGAHDAALDRNDNDDDCTHQRAYPPSLWPLVLNRLFVNFPPASYKFFAEPFHRLDDEDDILRDEDNHEDLERRRATVVYHLLLQGTVTDLV